MTRSHSSQWLRHAFLIERGYPRNVVQTVNWHLWNWMWHPKWHFMGRDLDGHSSREITVSMYAVPNVHKFSSVFARLHFTHFQTVSQIDLVSYLGEVFKLKESVKTNSLLGFWWPGVGGGWFWGFFCCCLVGLFCFVLGFLTTSCGRPCSSSGPCSWWSTKAPLSRKVLALTSKGETSSQRTKMPVMFPNDNQQEMG